MITTGGWKSHETDSGERYLTCDAITAAGVPHVFTLRPSRTHGGAGAGTPVDSLPAAGIPPGSIVHPRQVHGAVVAGPGGTSGTTRPPEADAVVITGAGPPAAVLTAD